MCMTQVAANIFAEVRDHSVIGGEDERRAL
jgi:hypothetical protein